MGKKERNRHNLINKRSTTKITIKYVINRPRNLGEIWVFFGLIRVMIWQNQVILYYYIATNTGHEYQNGKLNIHGEYAMNMNMLRICVCSGLVYGPSNVNRINLNVKSV